ncbi:ATP synthase subunit I [Neobacillus sp. D3-1R]|uniref:ATP synthase subunit I n=1 Tax=Neobacillus sp. D3-1R TaxID=3445778 RepID=UPI003FA183F6
MSDLNQLFQRQRRYMFLLLAVYVLGWGFTSYQSIFAGLILGTVFSFMILLLLARRAQSFDKAVTQGKKVRSLGSLSRLATAAIAIMIALKYENYFHTVSVVVGLMTTYVVIIIDYFLLTFLQRK